MYFERKKYVKIRNFWFETDRNRSEESGADFAEYHDLARIPADKTGVIGIMKRQTLVTDLTADEEVLKSAFRKNTKYEIRRAVKEGCTAVFYDADVLKKNDELIRKINREHARLFRMKGARVKDEYPYMHAAASKNMLSASAAFFSDQAECVYHVYVTGNKTARLLHSVSVYRDAVSNDERSAIGRANRFLHFQDMMHFKEMGYAVYDWGGYSQEEEFKSISDFKLSFGGREETVYTIYYAASLLGKLLSGAVKKFWLKGFAE